MLRTALLGWALLVAVPMVQAQLFQDSFDYADGPLTAAAGGGWVTQTAGTALRISQNAAVIDQGDLTQGRERVSHALPTSFNASTRSTVFVAFSGTWTSLPITPTGSYFLHLSTATNGSTFYARVGADTDGAADGTFRVAVANANWGQANTAEFPQDLALNTPYLIVVKYDLITGHTTLWLNPDSESSPSVTSVDPPAGAQLDIAAISLRQGLSNSNTGAPGVIRLDDLRVGERFDDVVAVQPIEIAQQPQSVTVSEGETAHFAAQVLHATTLQWLRNDQPVPNAGSSSLDFGPVLVSQDQSRFQLVASNRLGVIRSGVVQLHVLPDTTAPQLTSWVNLDSNTIELTFSEPLALPGATNPIHYSIDSGARVLSAGLGSDARQVLLTTTPLLVGTRYTLGLSELFDRAENPNPIAANTSVTLVASELVLSSVGDSTPADAVTPLAGGGYAVTSSGRGLGGANDQTAFAWQLRTGDFDQRVRVERLDLVDVWSQAALMVREPGGANSRFAAAIATPSLSGAYFESRSSAGAPVTKSGSHPVNYPQTWLRLRRTGNTVTGFAGFDGIHWSTLGSVTVALPLSVQLGVAAGAHSTNEATTAHFRDFSAVDGGEILPGPNLPAEPLGPSSRKTGLVISEILFAPAERSDGRHVAFIELFNSNPWPDDISGYRLSGDFNYTFPEGTQIEGGGFLVVGASPADLKAVYGLSNALGPWTASAQPTGSLRLINNGDIPAVYLEVPYLDFASTSTAANGTGHSLVLARPSYGEGFSEAWGISEDFGGSPGSQEPYRPSPLRNIVINEFVAHPATGTVGFVELYNHQNQAVDLSGCRITAFPGVHQFVIPNGTTIPERGFLSWDATQLGFTPNRKGGALYLLSPDRQQILDVVTYEPQEQGVAFGRVPNGGPSWYRLRDASPDQANGPIRASDIVINELMYQPLSQQKEDEYVEVYNQGATPIDLSGWEFNHGIKYVFPEGTRIPADSYLVVGGDLDRLRAHYPQLTAANSYGPFSGSLSGKGERVALAAPKPFIEAGKKGTLVTNLVSVIVDEVSYRDGGRWGHWADGGGSSLELRDPRADRRSAGNWADSDETAKAAWVTLEATSRLDLGGTQNGSPIDRLEVQLLGEGEALIDNVEVIESVAGTNLLTVANSTFESGLGGWFAQGDHVQSYLEATAGVGGSHCLHLKATDRGDTMANHARVPLSKPLRAGQTVTLRAQIRWLRGFPEMLLRVEGNYAEAAGSFHPPTNLGTPGAPNSQRVLNAGPALAGVTHVPPLPQDRQPVVVTAFVNDPDGVAQVTLNYRLDPATTSKEVAMRDDGMGGDAIAGDGIFSATIPGQPAGTLVAFSIRATDANTIPATSSFPNDAPVRECLVRFGEPAPSSGFGTYHFWLTQSNATRWANLLAVSNERHDATFVYGNSRVIYNVRGKYAGSPYHQGFGSPLNNNCHYSLEMPGDDQLLGATSFSKIHAPGNGPWEDDTLQREQTAYEMVRKLKLPWNYRRYVNFFINGTRRQPAGLMEDTQTPDSDVVKEHFPDDADGFLYKLQPWFEFADDAQNFENKSWCTLNNYLSDGQKKLARYRPNFLTRAAGTTANNYTNVYQLVDTAGLPSSTPQQVEQYLAAMDGLINTEEWLRITAIEHAVGNWDSFLNSNGQNMYAYKPLNGRWTLFIWDYNIVLGLGGYSDGPTGDNLFKTTSGDSGSINRFMSSPKYRRILWRAYEEIANGIMDNTKADPLISARYNAFQTEGITATSPTVLKSWIRSRHNYLLSQLKTVATTFAISSNGGVDYETSDNPALLTGTAPIGVQDITVNGIVRPVTWTDVRHWQISLPLTATTNELTVRGLDRKGQPLAGSEARIVVTYTGILEPPAGNVAINEIMYHASSPQAEYIELYNASKHTPYDLSYWRLSGAHYFFPPGTVLPVGGYLVLARNRAAFRAMYGTVPVFGECTDWEPQSDGELQLIAPATNPSEDQIVSSVHYGSTAPWPSSADGQGPSLQRIDPIQSSARPANWTASATNADVQFSPGKANTVGTVLPPFPSVWINEILPVNQSNHHDGADEADPYIELYNSGTEPIELAGFGLSDDPTQPTRWTFPSGSRIQPGGFLVVWADGQPEQSSPAEPHTSFRLDADSGTVLLSQPTLTTPSTVLHSVDYAGVLPGKSRGAFPDGQPSGWRTFATVTPGTPNSLQPGALPVFINEWMAANSHTLINSATGQADDWFELYNAGDQTVDLSGLLLLSPADNPSPFTVPVGTQLRAHEILLVWADKVPGANAPGSPLHTSFHLSKAGTQIVLAQPNRSVIDQVSFGPQSSDQSQGRAQDGQDAPFVDFAVASPGMPNLVSILSADRGDAEGSVALRFPTQPGFRYRLLARDALSSTWSIVTELQAISTEARVLVDTFSSVTRYYRLIAIPQQ